MIKNLQRFNKELRRFPEIKEVPKKPYGVYIGHANYKTGVIKVLKNLNQKDKLTTIAHEIGHFKFRQLKPKFNREVLEEMKKTRLYKELKKEGYPTHKIPQEMFAEIYGELKTNGNETKRKWKEFKRNNPTTAKKFEMLMAKKWLNGWSK